MAEVVMVEFKGEQFPRDEGGLTKANDIKETERRIGENIPLLGVVLNKSEHIEAGDYSY